MGPPTILTKQEESLLETWIIAINKEMVVETVKKIITDENRPNPFKENTPGRKWFSSFLKRHPDVATQYLVAEGVADILEDPERIINADESGFKTSPSSGLVLGPRRKCGLYPFDANAISYEKCITDSSRHDIPKKPAFIGPEHLLYFESLMSSSRVREFRANQDSAWTGDESAKELFYVWQKITKRVKQTAVEEEPNLEINLQTMQENIHDLEENVTSHENEEENYQTPEQMKEDFISNVDHLNTGTPSQPETHSLISQSTKRRKKVRLPDAVNSSEWMQYWNEKENIKKEQEEKKALKAANRKMSKKNKKKETGSDEEIPAAPRKMRRLRIDSASESDDGNVPLIVHKSLEVTAKPKKGDYVIIRYEGAYFPGTVENTDGDLYKISTMTFSTGNTFHWPEQCDKIWYQKDAVEEKIAVPTLANSQGFYRVPEMDKFMLKI
ncbi:hypothetical protein EVAR_9936_1 [Eumeta japonica]|uniref:HTH CENPB-type domain-containing protein n=1 Tax=Eumeta variegata TaxID=151549 RepID=A0A4C1TQS9_EUMVA|nr:hypothetical protein EVAR_9936_1 [Eumeta japonica]